MNYPVIKSGHRLVLRYKLIHTKECQKASASALVKGASELPLILDSWRLQQGSVCPRFMVYPLNEIYDNNDMRYSSLRGPDQSVFGQLLDDCKDRGVRVCLATTEKIDKNSSNFCYTTYEITHFSGSDGIEPLLRSTRLFEGGNIIGARHSFSEKTKNPVRKIYIRSVS